MSYTIYYSDPAKINYPIIVQDDIKYNSVGSGGLTLLGRNYPGYGQSVAENFVHLLENFSSPVPPVNAIEGQLWYDSSTGKLRINDGAGNNTRWRPVNGFFQDDNPPPNVNKGDLWVDTANNQVKIYNGAEFITVGPKLSSNPEETSGTEVREYLSADGTTQTVIINLVKGEVVEIISNEKFQISGVNGFDQISTGSNLSRAFGGLARYNGTAASAERIIQNGQEVLGNYFVRNDINQTINGQINISQDGNALKIGINPTFILERENQYSANFVNTYPNYGEFNFKVYSDNNIVSVFRVVGTTERQGVRVLAKTAASSSLTGALQVVGGAGIQGDVFVGGKLKVDRISAVNGLGIPEDDNKPGYALFSDKNGIYWGEVNTSTAAFATGGTVGGILKVISEVNTATSPTTGALRVLGGVGISEALHVGSTKQSSTGTGAFVVAGGASIAKDLYVGGMIHANTLTIQNTIITTSTVVTDDIISTTNDTQSTTSTNGALVINGGAGIGKNLNVGGNLTVWGSVSGNDIRAVTSINITNGNGGEIPYQVAPGVTGFISTGSAGYILQMGTATTASFVSTSSIYVNSAVLAETIRRGEQGQLVYQSAPNVTSFINTGTETDLLVSRPGAPAFESTSSIYVGFSNMARQWQTSRTTTFDGNILQGYVLLDGTQDTIFTATIRARSISLGTSTYGIYVEDAFTFGHGISGSAASEGATFNVTVNSTSSNFANTIMYRDGFGRFSATVATLFTTTSVNIYGDRIYENNARVWTTATLTDNSQLTNGANYITPASLAAYGVTATVGTTYLGVSTQSGLVVFTNLGVQTIVAGTDTQVTATGVGNTGTITINSTDTLQSVTGRGATTDQVITITAATPSTVAGTGALRVTGGISAGAGLFVTGAATVTNNLAVSGGATVVGDFAGQAGGTIAGNFTATAVYADAVYDLGARAWTTATLTDNGQLTNGGNYLKTVTPLGGQSISVTAVSTSAPNTQFTINNTGVTGTIGTTYLGVSGPTGRVVLTNLGVQTLTAGTDTAVSQSTGTVVVWSNATLETVSLRGSFATSIIRLTNGVDSTGTASGTLVVAGGIGLSKNLTVGGSITVDSTATLRQNLNVVGPLTAYSFAGTGSGLTSIPNTALVTPFINVTGTAGVSVNTTTVRLGETLDISYSGISSITTGSVGIDVITSNGVATLYPTDTLQDVANRGQTATTTITVNNVITRFRPSIRVNGTSTVGAVINSGTAITGTFTTIETDRGFAFNSTSGVFTAPFDGVYHVFFNGYSTATDASVMVMRNNKSTGTDIVAFWSSNSTTSGTYFGVNSMIGLGVGDYVSATVTSGSIVFDDKSSWGVCFIG